MTKKLFKCFIFIMIFIELFSLITYILRDKDHADRQYPFFQEKKDSIDILLLGPSTMDLAVSPMDLWHEYGYTSYNLANSGQSIPINYYVCKTALKTQSPQLIVLDLAYLFQQDKLADQPQQLRRFIDNVPISIDKIQCICDLTETKEWPDYFFNLTIYHTRWKRLYEQDFKEIITFNKGATTIIPPPGTQGYVNELQVLPESEKIDISIYKYSIQYLSKIKALCDSKNIDFLCINLPSYATGETNHGNGEELQKMWNGFSDFAKSNNISYINMLHHLNEIGIDFSTDFGKDDWRHMGYFCSRKVTTYLGKYIQNHYDITDHRQDAEYDSWNQDYIEFENYINILKAKSR